MPRAPKEVKRPAHRPQKPIDWNRVDELILKGCLGTEIAPRFDMHAVTFYNRVELEKGVTFTEYCIQKRPEGEGMLREAQFDKAMKGDTSMLIWMGKQRLNQRETTTIDVPPETVKSFQGLMEQLEELQKHRMVQKNTTNQNEGQNG